ncbi:SirB2 family protein [Zeimonas arvi]|uniref:Regulator SirB n=1 Tax=Zeimonas arvi TaxID=2498847 RepID=A0A5C8NVR5_9BURK|nr:SirB2 family protein [Zeimonas arvi]TXL65327.1 regulator SirB [Zeimonas arvi]
MLDYTALKHIHATAATISIAGFALRYAWMIAGSPRLHSRAAKVLPHIVDTILLASAILLAVQAGIAPWSVGWLGFKVIGLVVYIVLGTIALKRGRTRGARIAAGAAAIALFGAIVWAARYKSVPLLGAL